MVIEWKFEFNVPVPSYEELLETLQKNTGLTDVTSDDNFGFSHPIFKEDVFYVMRTTRTIKVVVVARNRSWYLLEAFFAVLEDFGGSCGNFEAQLWGREKWENVKDRHYRGELFYEYLDG